MSEKLPHAVFCMFDRHSVEVGGTTVLDYSIHIFADEETATLFAADVLHELGWLDCLTNERGDVEWIVNGIKAPSLEDAVNMAQECLAPMSFVHIYPAVDHRLIPNP